ncbi:MAG TPA: GNAT family N-acetyltransferase, partial [Candidatus Binatus sp.]|nr:GNAT family N-acetyltransferase [Candidatus Binatus sp.]
MTEPWVRPVTLDGRLVRLEPLSEAHLAGLAEVAFDASLWRWTVAQPTDLESLGAWLAAALRNREAGIEMPFATIERASGRPIGSTRFMSIVPEHRRLEIGWTWVARPWQRHGANREAKYLQLR